MEVAWDCDLVPTYLPRELDQMVNIAANWFLHVDVGPEWLFLRLGKISPNADPAPPVAERAWGIVDQHQIHRVVFELESDVALTSHLIGQLVALHKRCQLAGGVMRICGFDDAAYEIIKIMRLDARFPNYRSRQDAVVGNKPA